MPFMCFIYCTINSLNFVDGTNQNICVLKVLTAFLQGSKSCRSLRFALCSRHQRCGNAVQSPSTLWKRCEDVGNHLARHAAAFILNMLKTNAALRLHSVLDSTLWGRCDNAAVFSRAPWARCVRAVCTLYRRLVNLDSAFAMHFDNNINNHKICLNACISIIMNSNGTVI